MELITIAKRLESFQGKLNEFIGKYLILSQEIEEFEFLVYHLSVLIGHCM